MVKLIMKYGPNIDAQDTDEKTPLIHASLLNNIELVSLFIEAGGDLSVRDTSGKTALVYARKTTMLI